MTTYTSTKPYMVRAIHEWCIDNGLTPHLLVAVDAHTRVPMAYVKDGEIVLNINYTATKDLHIDNEAISFSARFGGVSQNLYVPMHAVKGLFARENGQGMFFEVGTPPENTTKPASNLLHEANTAKSKADLKALIILGKERGYVTYAEIKDHVADDVQDSEQIDAIISMINDMGIQVYESAPDKPEPPSSSQKRPISKKPTLTIVK